MPPFAIGVCKLEFELDTLAGFQHLTRCAFESAAVQGTPRLHLLAGQSHYLLAPQTRTLFVSAIDGDVTPFKVLGDERIRHRLHHGLLEVQLRGQFPLRLLAPSHFALQQQVGTQRHRQHDGYADQQRQQTHRRHAPGAVLARTAGHPFLTDALLFCGRHRQQRAIDQPGKRRQIGAYGKAQRVGFADCAKNLQLARVALLQIEIDGSHVAYQHIGLAVRDQIQRVFKTRRDGYIRRRHVVCRQRNGTGNMRGYGDAACCEITQTPRRGLVFTPHDDKRITLIGTGIYRILQTRVAAR